MLRISQMNALNGNKACQLMLYGDFSHRHADRKWRWTCWHDRGCKHNGSEKKSHVFADKKKPILSESCGESVNTKLHSKDNATQPTKLAKECDLV
jgi:hypothetical protein